MSILAQLTTPEGICVAADSRESYEGLPPRDDTEKIRRISNNMLLSVVGNFYQMKSSRGYQCLHNFEELHALISGYVDEVIIHGPPGEKIPKLIEAIHVYLMRALDPYYAAERVLLKVIDENRKEFANGGLVKDEDIEKTEFVPGERQRKYVAPFDRLETEEYQYLIVYTFPRSVHIMTTTQGRRTQFPVTLDSGPMQMAFAAFDSQDEYPISGFINYPFELKIVRPLEADAHSELYIFGSGKWEAEFLLALDGRCNDTHSTIIDQILRVIDMLEIPSERKEAFAHFLKERAMRVGTWKMQDAPSLLRTLLELSIIVSEVPFSKLAPAQELLRLLKREESFPKKFGTLSSIGGGVHLGVVKKSHTSSVEHYPPIFGSSHSAPPTLPNSTKTQ